jgi:autoinducer-2 kinase
MENGYILIDIGTGNTRVGICSSSGEILAVETCDTKYYKEPAFPDSFSFDPGRMWKDILGMIKYALQKAPGIQILAISSISQRQGIVLIDQNGESIIGLPNLDNRGLEWVGEIANTDAIYKLTGKWTNSIFSASKLRGVKERQQDIWDRIRSFTSISDWIGYQLTGVLGTEPSQACETLLFDASKGVWSKDLCEIFGIPYAWLPEIRKSGTNLGIIKPDLAKELGISQKTPFIVGGADTQLAIKGTQPEIEDVIIVSGTTTPITKLVGSYSVDELARCWVERYVDVDRFIIETNTGISGLNYQRMKQIICPDKSYEQIELEILQINNPSSIASFGSLIFDRIQPLPHGGFLFDAPVNQDLTISHFMFAVLFDIACSIKHNFDVLVDIAGHNKDYVLGCGGGFQGRVLPLLVADLLQKEVRIKDGFTQAGLVGGVITCNDTLGIENNQKSIVRSHQPSNSGHYLDLYEKWRTFRNDINDL